ncbi:hypothetical protein L7F22_054295, partial [Adiantum nelumboides]|nr:hypothetical protein [Adiantum nelumboides]
MRTKGWKDGVAVRLALLDGGGAHPLQRAVIVGDAAVEVQLRDGDAVGAVGVGGSEEGAVEQPHVHAGMRELAAFHKSVEGPALAVVADQLPVVVVHLIVEVDGALLHSSVSILALRPQPLPAYRQHRVLARLAEVATLPITLHACTR